MSENIDSKFKLDERRNSSRVAVRLGAAAFVSSSEKSVECTVLDISKTGARLELNDIDIIPSRLKLYIPEVDCIYDCEVAWRRKQQCGLKFINSVSL